MDVIVDKLGSVMRKPPSTDHVQHNARVSIIENYPIHVTVYGGSDVCFYRPHGYLNKPGLLTIIAFSWLR